MFELLSPDHASRKPRTSHAHVVAELGGEIVAGVFPVGSTLPGDAELEQRFHVSRTVLREAMKTLAAKGLVEARARIGTRVTDRKRWNLFDSDVLSWHFKYSSNEDLFKHLVDVRLTLEPAAAAMAALHASAEDIAELYKHADDMAAAESSTEFVRADLKLHLAVLGMSKNPFMWSVGSLIGAALNRIFHRSSPASNPEDIARNAGNHRAIVDAIAARDQDAASAAMRKVIIVGAERVAGKA
ncbi:FadR/GntR family transcriptional regulator [Roseibium litorale]|uniref:FadR family transcriptional regulator n=1 Tax=Roseibium litorale TaxID=2803841 RepID=A0ABR9CJV7_9HYPH|nr:FadR/GntR family transcriptional regulator [Roseibium litorale]MBD8891140.1 FadR family transcriptional regulator [Roseibium litorale]